MPLELDLETPEVGNFRDGCPGRIVILPPVRIFLYSGKSRRTQSKKETRVGLAILPSDLLLSFLEKNRGEEIN
jgi:hypothetical protein